MTRTCLPFPTWLPLALTFATAALPAQQKVGLSLLVRSAELPMDADFVASLLRGPALDEALTTAAGQPHRTTSAAYAKVTAGPNGIVQISLSVDVSPMVDQAHVAAAEDALQAFLVGRLSSIVYEVPRQLLVQQDDQLRTELASLVARGAQVKLRRETASSSVAALRAQLQDLDQQCAALAVDAQVEQRVLEHLQKVLDETRQRSRSQEQADLDAAAVQLQARSAELSDQLTAPDLTGNDRARIQDQLKVLADQLGKVTSDRRKIDGPVQETNHMLAALLERLPVSSLALRQAEARLEQLRLRRAEVAEQLDQAQRQSLAAEVDAAAELAAIDLTACRDRLAIVQARLRALEPVTVTRL